LSFKKYLLYFVLEMVENKNRCTYVTHTLGKAYLTFHARDKFYTRARNGNTYTEGDEG